MVDIRSSRRSKRGNLRLANDQSIRSILNPFIQKKNQKNKGPPYKKLAPVRKKRSMARLRLLALHIGFLWGGKVETDGTGIYFFWNRFPFSISLYFLLKMASRDCFLIQQIYLVDRAPLPPTPPAPLDRNGTTATAVAVAAVVVVAVAAMDGLGRQMCGGSFVHMECRMPRFLIVRHAHVSWRWTQISLTLEYFPAWSLLSAFLLSLSVFF